MSRLEEILNQVQASEAYQCSPVSFGADLLGMFIRGEIAQNALRNAYKTQTLNAQFYFRHMPKEHILENQRIFKREFDFADELSNILIKNPPVPDDVLKKTLLEAMEKYVESVR